MLKETIKNSLSIFLCLVILLGLSFSVTPTSNTIQAAAAFAKGADIGWLKQLEDRGVRWQNDNGVQQDPLQILKDHGIDSIRLRVFVNPPSNYIWQKTSSSSCLLGYSDQAGVVAAAQRAKNIGITRLMLDFHYSDHFADPAYQDKPAAWAGHSFTQLKTDVYNHTYNVMNALKSAGITPEWAAVGNEIPNGMLWPEGRTSNWSQLAQLINSGYDAIKAVSSSTKVVVHIDKGASSSTWFYDSLQNNGGKWDVIGLSYYPYWDGVDYTANINALGNNLNNIASRYGKEVMLVEVGGHENNPSNTYNYLVAAINKVKAVPNGRGIGVFYWEPEAHSSVLPDGYILGACSRVSNNVLKFTSALDAFQGTVNPTPTPTPGTTPTPTPPSGSYIKIRNRATGLCIDGMGRTSNGSNAGQYSSGSSYNQQWLLESAGSYYKIKNRATGLYLDGMGRTSNGSICGQWSSSSSNNQQWTREAVGSYYKFKNRATGLYLDGMGSTSNGADLCQYSSGSSYNQQWSIVNP